jgi:hypothetical protein
MKYKDSLYLAMCAPTVLSMLNNPNASSVSMNAKGSKRDGQTDIEEGGQTEQVIMLEAPKGGNSSLWKLKLQLAGEKL